MKQAILITAYKNFNQLITLTNAFSKDFNIYIHIDKKSLLTREAKQELMKNVNVKYLGQDYIINWGGLNHLKAYLKLSEIALNNKENMYFHLISGQDYPIKNNDYFKMIANEKKDYLSYHTMPARCWNNGGMDRLEYYNFYDYFDVKKSIWPSKIRSLQKKFKFKRTINNLGKLYGGSTYWSLTRDTLHFVLNFTEENPKFLKRFKYTAISEEIYFQTVIMNSKYSNNIVNDDLRYIDWESKRGGNPAFLDETDFKSLICSNMLFARKIDLEKNQLIQMIKNNLSNS